MFWFIFGILLFAVGLLVALKRASWSGVRDERGSSRSVSDAKSLHRALGLAAAFLIAAGIFTVVWDSFTVVPARNVGVVNTFGRADRSLDNGFHWVAPWSSVETVDATVQNINLDNPNCVTVRLANQTTACVDLTLQWNIDQNANANQLWQRYRGTNDDVVGNIGNNVVKRELIRALNVVFEKYNPLAVLTDSGAPTVSTGDLAQQALTILRQNMDPGIVVDTLLISVVHYDDTTQQKLNGYAQALADTQIATQQRKTAEQQKLANDQLATSSSNDPGVKYQNCLNLLKDLAAKGQLQNLPPTFNCGDSGTPVIVGQK